jgi:6,7-dimethyl-8-ribityllumazine synthase
MAGRAPGYRGSGGSPRPRVGPAAGSPGGAGTRVRQSRRSPSSGGSQAAGGFAIIAARFNERITTRLVDGAVNALLAQGVPTRRIEVHWVPGSFELPQAALVLARTRRFAALVCLGVVIRGQTPHFEHVAREAASGIRHVALTTGVPATFGVITALTEEQAWARAGGTVGNRGAEAAEAALAMAELVKRVGAGGQAS